MIEVLQEVLDYERRRGGNRPRPDLWIDDSTYLEEIKALVLELRRLNDLLEKKGAKAAAKTQSVLRLKKRADTFLTNFAATLGKGAGWLVIAVIASILYEAGVAPSIVAKFYTPLK